MTKYCLGFMFNEKETDVLLIQKNHPRWQAGKFNGIGGKLKEGETSLEAMQREFQEESGIINDDWKYIITMYGDDWNVDVFTCKDDDVFSAKSLEAEQVHLIPLADLEKYDLISNLYWLIPMCLDKNDDHKSGINYSLSNAPNLLEADNEMLIEANDIIRSCHSVIERKGADTNWEQLENKVSNILQKQHKVLYPETYMQTAP